MEDKQRKPLSSYSIALGIVALAFLIGVTGGCLVSVQGGAAADGAVAEYLSPLAQSAVPRPSVSRTLISAVLYPALCFAFGFAIPGVALIPLTVCARGFFLAYAAASCARVFGAAGGTLLSLSLFGLPLLLSLPCLFWLGAHGLLGSHSLLRSAMRKPAAPIKVKEEFFRFGMALCALAASAAVEIYVSPLLATLVAATL
ncbi:MAG: stage II sporulation protein M [Oscillospiraceae bacterium]|jgi:hypothetical protein|nr:stage II sporulation protein M [Oscillospiraceae bacterium]